MNNKNKTLITALGLIFLACLMLFGMLISDSGNGNDERSDSSSQAQAIITESESDSLTDISEQDSQAQTTTTTAASTPAADSSQAPAVTDEPESKTYTFRSQKLFDQHFEKHGAEFGDITQEDYLRMANELISSKSDTVLSKTEKEDGDYVFFDTETGHFAVLSTDGYIRTFFIPDQGIKYYNKQ